MWQKNKNLLGLVSNLQQLSSHQRKTAYGEGRVRGCLLKRITALKGSEAKQRYEFRCSRGVPGRGDNTIESAQTLKKCTMHLFIYSSTHHSIHPSIYCFYFVCVFGEHISGVAASGKHALLENKLCSIQHRLLSAYVPHGMRCFNSYPDEDTHKTPFLWRDTGVLYISTLAATDTERAGPAEAADSGF